MVSRLARQGILPKTVIDVGANAGQFAVASAKLFPNVTVHSFEPNPESVRQLQKNVSRLANVLVYSMALGDQTGEIEFHVNTYSQSSSILPLAQAHKTAFPSAQEKETIRVKLSTLDDALADTMFTPPTLLKLDVQGYEARTLAGASKTLKRIDYVVIETCFQPMYEGESVFRDILAIMEEQGFCFARPIDFAAVQGGGEIVQMDALFIRSSIEQ